MSKANKSGILLEDMIYRVLESFNGINVTKQYPLKDIFGVGKIDFKIEYRNKYYFLEAKNQTVAGSVDQKLPFYIENIREMKYPGHFIFVINGDGIRNGAMSYLKNKQKELDFSIIEFERLEQQLSDLFQNNIVQTVDIKVKPVIKWAGGKRMIMERIKNLLPEKILGNYYEPFCGGFSVACELFNSGRLGEKTIVHLNDNIPQLITLYKVIQNDPVLLLNELKKPEYIVTKDNFEINKERYNNFYNTEVETAALFLFLNKSGYNGVYRENKEGKYNVPFCKKEFTSLYEEENIYSMHNFLKRCILTCEDYKTVLQNTTIGDVIYCDPPYHSTFNSYSKVKFEEQDQKELAKYCRELKDNGRLVFVSNSDTDFVRDLYRDCDVHKIPMKRVVNSKSEDRSNINYELFINI
jgi:DNA adenine methylase